MCLVGGYKEGFQKRIDEGKVSVQELSLLVKQGADVVEADDGLEGESFSDIDINKAEAEYYSLCEGKGYEIASNPKHPEYLAYKSRKAQLARILKLPS